MACQILAIPVSSHGGGPGLSEVHSHAMHGRGLLAVLTSQGLTADIGYTIVNTIHSTAAWVYSRSVAIVTHTQKVLSLNPGGILKHFLR